MHIPSNYHRSLISSMSGYGRQHSHPLRCLKCQIHGHVKVYKVAWWNCTSYYLFTKPFPLLSDPQQKPCVRNLGVAGGAMLRGRKYCNSSNISKQRELGACGHRYGRMNNDHWSIYLRVCSRYDCCTISVGLCKAQTGTRNWIVYTSTVQLPGVQVFGIHSQNNGEGWSPQ